MSILHKKVLMLNASWLPVGVSPVKKVLEDMNSSRSPKKALKIEYFQYPNGDIDYNNPIEIIPLFWDEWVTLAPRSFDEDSIRTIKMEIRVPTVAIVGSNYNQLPIKTFRPTKRNVYEKYGGIDYWTGEKISYHEATLDHVQPKSKGGNNTWENLAVTKGKINRLKDRMDPKAFEAEYGYKPHYKLKAPPPMTAHILIRALNPDWAIFLDKIK